MTDSRRPTAQILLAALLTLLPGAAHAQRASLLLDGTWEFRPDPTAVGDADGWAAPQVTYPRTIRVPGAWQAQGVGEPGGTLRHDYAGIAWYRRTLPVPAGWKGKTVSIRIGGAHRHTTVFVNGRKVGEHGGFSAPFSFDVTEAIQAGGDNVIAMRIANPGAVPLDGPREQKPLQPTGMLNYIGNWGGPYGRVELRATEPAAIDDVYVRPDIVRSAARIVVTVRNGEAKPFVGEVRISAGAGVSANAPVTVPAGGQTDVEASLSIPNAHLWTPDTPHLYTARVTLHQGKRTRDQVDERFGMRQFTTRGEVLLLNGTPLYLRGYGDDNIEVIGGFPPSDRDTYLQRLRQARAFGFNTVRFHSMTPPEEFFHAADEVGMLVMAELPAAYTQYVLPHREMLRRELADVVRAYRNRPSLLSLAFGNEFNLTWLETETERKTFLDTVADFYTLAKSLHPDGLVLSNDGYVMKPTDMVSHYGVGVSGVPVVKHEFGEYYCSLPDISLIDKFTGVFLPGWLNAKQAWVRERALDAQYPQYVANSQRLQQLGRKYQIERVRRRQDVTGYHYWLIVDFPGGTGEGDSWEEGWFDYFWRPKHITPAEGQAINGAVLPLLDVAVSDRTQWNDAPREVGLLLSNYGNRDLSAAPLSWRLTEGDRTLASGAVQVTQPMGKVGPAATITLPALPHASPRALSLTVEVGGATANSWSLWSFPREGRFAEAPVPVRSRVKWAGIARRYPFVSPGAPATTGQGLLLTPTLDEEAVAHLRAGGRVWLMAERGTTPDRDGISFFPAAGGALGTVIADHPALSGYPHEGFADLQFFNLIDGAVPIALDRWPTTLTPIIGGIRTKAGFLSKTKDLSEVAYAFEARVGEGRLLVTSLRFRDHFDEAYPEALDLFDRLLRYATGQSFAPTVEVGDEQLRLLAPR